MQGEALGGPHPLRSIGLVTATVLVGLAIAVNLLLVAVQVVYDRHVPFDWNAYMQAAERFPGPDLYTWNHDYLFRYAPLAAPLLGLAHPLGIAGWRFAQLLAVTLLPTPGLAVLVALSYPFILDLSAGNILTFTFLLAAWAWRGNRVATALFLVLTCLVPRPLMLPLAAWIVWRRREWRIPFAVIVLSVIGSTIALGYLGPWITALVGSAGDIGSDLNLGPSRVLGLWWLLAGIPLAVYLTARGKVGWASIAISPYLLPYYWLMVGLEFLPSAEQQATVIPPWRLGIRAVMDGIRRIPGRAVSHLT